jgi:hypothetical protein
MKYYKASVNLNLVVLNLRVNPDDPSNPLIDFVQTTESFFIELTRAHWERNLKFGLI